MLLTAAAWFFDAAPVLACEFPQALARESVRVSSVYDGDSLRLADGRRVRLVGVNAPERARDQQAGQPLAMSARKMLSELAEGRRLTLVYDEERTDHYGRTLAYAFDASGRSLEAELLRAGLAFHIAIPPNLSLADCLAEAQNDAREASRGVWGHPEWAALSASELGVQHTGFQRVRGVVAEVSRAGGSVWVELDGPLVLRVTESVWSRLGEGVLVPGARLEVRGWVIDRSDSSAARRGFKPLMMRVRSPYALDIQAPTAP